MTAVADLFGVHARCACCGVTAHLTIDHRVPRSLGGSNDRDNLRPCCWRCNQVKSQLEHMFIQTYRALNTDAGRDRWVNRFRQALSGWCHDRRHGYRLVCRCNECQNAPILFGADVPAAAVSV